MGEAERYLAVGAVLFALGAIGFLTRRNMIVMVLSVELMLHGVSLTLVTFSRMHHTLEGQAFTIFILTVSACEAALALALILALYQKRATLDVELWCDLREPDVAPPEKEELAEEDRLGFDTLPPLPTLSPAGLEPVIRRELLSQKKAIVAPAPEHEKHHPHEVNVTSVP